MEKNEKTNRVEYSRQQLEIEIAGLNGDEERKALDEFAKSEEALCVQNADIILKGLEKGCAAIRAGKPPDQLSSLVAREIETLLVTKTWTECMQYEIRNDLTPGDLASLDLDRLATHTWKDLVTEEYCTWLDIVHAFASFLRDAAAFALRVGADAAARQYIIAWRRVSAVDGVGYTYLPRADARDAMTRVREANDLLWAHVELESLKVEGRKGKA